MMLSFLLLASAASGHTLSRTPVQNRAFTPSVRTNAPKTTGALPYVKPSNTRSVLSNAAWTRRAFEVLGFRRNAAERAAAARREVNKDELYVVTGGGSGIGQAAALRLAKRGASVMVIGRRESPLQETKNKATAFKGEIIPVVADVTTDDGRDRIAESVKRLQAERDVTLRGLVHNAAVNTPCKKMMELPKEEWLKVADINVNGPLFLTQALYPLFGKTDQDKNRVMMLSSVARTCSGLPAYGPYCVTKLTFYGLHLMFKEEMCAGDANPRVHSASLIPGEVDTEMQRNTAYGQEDGVFPEHLVKYWREIQESGQLLPPEVTGAFMEYVLCDTAPEDFSKDEWFIYDKKHHKKWAYEFPKVKIVEPAGLF